MEKVVIHLVRGVQCHLVKILKLRSPANIGQVELNLDKKAATMLLCNKTEVG